MLEVTGGTAARGMPFASGRGLRRTGGLSTAKVGEVRSLTGRSCHATKIAGPGTRTVFRACIARQF